MLTGHCGSLALRQGGAPWTPPMVRIALSASVNRVEDHWLEALHKILV